MEDVRSRYFLRVEVEDRIGMLAELTDVFARHKVSVEQIIQKKRTGNSAEIVVITEEVRDGDFRKAVQCIADKSGTREIKSTIRVYTE